KDRPATAPRVVARRKGSWRKRRAGGGGEMNSRGSSWERRRLAGTSLNSQCAIPPARRQRSQAAFTIIECMVYIGVYVTLLGFASFAFYRCYDHMKNMRRN